MTGTIDQQFDAATAYEAAILAGDEHGQAVLRYAHREDPAALGLFKSLDAKYGAGTPLVKRDFRGEGGLKWPGTP